MKVSSVERQLKEVTNDPNPHVLNRKNEGNGNRTQQVDPIRKKYAGPTMTLRDNKMFQWCPKHIAPDYPDGLHVVHTPEDKDEWKTDRQGCFKIRRDKRDKEEGKNIPDKNKLSQHLRFNNKLENNKASLVTHAFLTSDQVEEVAKKFNQILGSQSRGSNLWCTLLFPLIGYSA